MENLNRVLLENVLPAHVAEHFLARSLKNEVRGQAGAGRGHRGLRGCRTAALHTACAACPWSETELRC
jgi:hypothetical protein